MKCTFLCIVVVTPSCRNSHDSVQVHSIYKGLITPTSANLAYKPPSNSLWNINLEMLSMRLGLYSQKVFLPGFLILMTSNLNIQVLSII